MLQARNLTRPNAQKEHTSRVQRLSSVSSLSRSRWALPHFMLQLGYALIIGVVGGCGSDAPQPGNVLHGAAASDVRNVAHAERITDGRAPRNGDQWRSNLSAELKGAGARITYDLGASKSIDALYLIADNNDRFELLISEDNQQYSKLWSAPSVPDPGMRPRFASKLGGHGRYLRITAHGGDPFVSIGELLAFSTTPEPFPPAVKRSSSGSMYVAEQRALMVMSLVIGLAMLACFARVPAWLSALAVALALGAVIVTAKQLAPSWPFHEEILSLFRVMLAALGALGLAVARLSHKEPARSWAITSLLSLVAALSIACFYNFGRPWFWDFIDDRPTPVHTFDMRVYYPVAKYFDELRFDGLYFASVAAYVEDKPVPIGSIASTELRDLRDNQMVKVRDVVPEIERIHERFSDARWRSFKEDMRYFWKTMAHDYLSTLRDHGGNATPAWIALAHLLFAGTQASERVLTLTGLFDPLLFLTLCVCIWRSFGRYTALACMIIFGATDFPMLGSNWAGATLRFDWMTALGFAACAFRTGRPALAGAFLGYAAMMRAFPVLSLALLVGGVLVQIGWQAYRARSWPRWAELRGRHRAAIAATRTAALVMVAFFALSTALFGFKEGWGEWAHKISIHNEKSNTNHVGLRTALSFDPELTIRKVSRMPHEDLWRIWHDGQRATYHAREPLFWLGVLLFVGAAVLVCMNAPFERAAVLGLLLVPVLSYPANYYLHAVYILPLLASTLPRVRAYLIELILLAMCAAQYWTLGITYPMGGDERFFWQSIILLAATALLLTVLARPQPLNEESAERASS